ncbi:MAG: 50S ribosomal protein L2 [Nanoarchaeota archaeon]
MGKRIIQQARGKGSLSYRVPKKNFVYKLKYLRVTAGEGTIRKLINSSAHSAPLAKIQDSNKEFFYVPAVSGIYEGQKISLDQGTKAGDINYLKNIPIKTKVSMIESRPRDGGKFIKTAGSFAIVNRIVEDKVYLIMPSKKEKVFNGNCRAIIGVIAGDGRLEKPMMKAGKNHYAKKAKNKLWPRTSALKFNAIDHPFGSGRGKNPKPKIAKRNSPPGAKVGLLRPKRTGKKK